MTNTDGEKLTKVLNAITYTLEEANDLDWLRAWVHGDPEAMKELDEWEQS